MKLLLDKACFLIVFFVLTMYSVNAENTNYFAKLSLHFSPPDTVKPRVDLLGVDTIIVSVGEEFKDKPIALIDDVNSDAEMRFSLFNINNLPRNQFGNHFCDQAGYFKSYYWVRDLSNNQSDTVFRTILCEAVLSGLYATKDSQKVNIKVNPLDGIIFLNLSKATSEKVEVTILDILGNRIQSYQAHATALQEFTFPLPAVAFGIHLIKVQIGDNIYTKKLVF